MAAGESLTLVYANSQWNEVARSSSTIGPLTAFVFPYGTDSAPTGEGSAYCNSTTDACTIGDGSAANVLAKIAKGNVWLGANDFGGATSLEIPNSDDPDVDATGEISFDTDGWLRIYETSQKAIARIQEEIHVTVVKPQDMADAVRDAFLVWSNESGMTFTVTGWKCWAGTDDTTLNIETTAADGSSNATVDAVECATGSGPYTGSDTTITAGTIANGSLIWLDFDDTDDPSYVKLTIYGYYNADVN